MISMEQKIAHAVRILTADAIERSGSGHPGMPLGCAEIGAVLYSRILRHDPANPGWPDRDRFVLSAGHGSMLLYSLLHLSGYALTLDDLRKHRTFHSITPGHPEHGLTPGVEVTTGPLGQGFAHAVGLALAEAMLAARFNRQDFTIVDHRTYTLVSDGDLMEGVSYEAASLAGHLKLHKLIAIHDSNRITFDGPVDASYTESVSARFRACGWQVSEVDGHDVEALHAALDAARDGTDKPSLIVASTRIARYSIKEDRVDSHGTPLGAEAVAALKVSLGFPPEPFFVPQDVRSFFGEQQKVWKAGRKTWEESFEVWSMKYPELRKDWDAAHSSGLPLGLGSALSALPITGSVSARQLGGDALQVAASWLPNMVGGAADVTTSTKAWILGAEAVSAGRYAGRNIRFGIREHAMGAICNGIALHGGFRVFASTFLTFSDYLRPTIRLAALMGLPVIYILTHDSVYVGEDGATHQAVEQTESLRAMPNLRVFRPGPTEVGLVWLLALERTEGPTALILSRQSVSCPAAHLTTVDGVRHGGYIFRRESGSCRHVLSLIASGSELDLSWKVADILETQGLGVRIVSVPCREVFCSQDPEYVYSVLGSSEVRRAVIEAGVGGAWYRLLRSGDTGFFVERFGESGSGAEVAASMGLSVESIVAALSSLVV